MRESEKSCGTATDIEWGSFIIIIIIIISKPLSINFLLSLVFGSNFRLIGFIVSLGLILCSIHSNRTSENLLIQCNWTQSNRFKRFNFQLFDLVSFFSFWGMKTR